MIELKKLTKMYRQTMVIQNANYTFPNTGLVCLLGESGSGKTTLMNLISGLDSEYQGKIIVDNVELRTLSVNDLCNYRKDYTGFIFQDYHLLDNYTVIENIIYPGILKSDDLTWARQQAMDLLKKMDLTDKVNAKVQNLSGGQKQRVAIARALIKNPNIILADEPTGSLDRKSSIEIMQILKEISKTKLVILITHDHHICDYADEIITIEDKKIAVLKNNEDPDNSDNQQMILIPPKKIIHLKLAYKNFKISLKKYLLVASVFSIGVLCIILSLSFSNIIDKSIVNFKEKNVSFNNGYIKNDSKNIKDNTYKKLISDVRIENVYKQYVINNVSLSINNHSELMKEKYPMPKSKESMSYGTMPRVNKKEIALTPSLAKKFNPKINDLIGKKLILKYNSSSYSFTVSGIYNAEYDDFFVSSDIEQTFYHGKDSQSYYSISYDVKKFEDIVEISEQLSKENIQSVNVAEQVKTMEDTFSKIQMLFFIISGLILFVAIYIVIIILIKIQSVRYKMIGLLYSFGFNKKMVSKIVIMENVLLTLMTAFFTLFLIVGSQFIAHFYDVVINLSRNEFILTIVLSSIGIFLINAIINRRLINIRPTIALKR